MTPDSAGIPAPAGKWRQIALALALAAYFLWFNWGSLGVHFASDDLANIAHYFEYAPGRLILANFLPWRGDYRPMGGVYYMAVYHFAGLNPLPYQAVLLAILAANAWFAWRAVRLLGGGELPAALVALVCCYHGGIANLYYNAAFVYDALCSLFYLAALVYYLGVRRRGRGLRAAEIAVFLLIFLCALNSKEMAVSLPVMILVYEFSYHPPRGNLAVWLRGPVRVAWIGAALTLVDLYGKVAGANAMISTDAYHPVFTWGRVLAFQVALYQDLFFSWSWTPGWGQIVGGYAILAYLAWRRPQGAPRPALRFLFCFLLVGALPIEFLEGRREACFALLMAAGAAFVAIVFGDAVEASARYLAREFRLPPAGRSLVAGVMVAAAVLIWVRDQRRLRLDVSQAPMTTLGAENWDIVQQLRASSFHPRGASSVAFLDDPFHSLTMYHLARLWFHDRSITILVRNGGPPLSQKALAGADYVFTFGQRKLIRLR